MAKKPNTSDASAKPRSFTTFAAVLVAMTLAIAIVLNLLARRLNLIWDMTPTNMYRLTDTSRDYLATLDKDVDFYFLLDMDLLSTDMDSMALYRALKEYASYDRIHFQDFEPDSNPELTETLQAKGYSLSRGDIVIECEGRSMHISGNTMFQNFVDPDTNMIQSTYFAGENYITGAIDAVVSGRDTAIYFLTGHGEKSLSTDYTKLLQNLSNRNYRAEALNLGTADSVPEDASIVILAAPQLDITRNEMRLLNEYLDRGGNVCFWMSPNEAETDYPNIESILDDYAIGMDYDIVEETHADFHVSSDPRTFRCSVVAPEDEDAIDLTSGVADFIDAGILPFMTDTRSFYQKLNNTDTSLTVGSLLQTVANATDEMGNPTSTAIGKPYGGTSAIADTITNQILDLAMFSTSSTRNNSKIMVMGNAEFIDDTNVAQDYMVIPVNLMLSVFSWMYDSDQTIDMGIADKERTYDSLVLNSETAANTTNIIFIVVPVLVGLVGGGVWLKRRYS